MFIFKDTKLRANAYAPYVDSEGTQHLRIPLELLEEIPDPVPPEDFSQDLYYVTEQDAAPYVVFTKKSDEQIAQIQQAKLNADSLAYLSETDWMVTRFAETGTPIPEEVKLKRQTARDAIIYEPEGN